MRSLVLSLGVCLALVSFVVSARQSNSWLAFKREHGKVYEIRATESMRRAIFERNKQYIDQFNAEQSEAAGYKLSLNHLSDWSDSEIKQLMGYKSSKGIKYLLKNSPKAEKFINNILNDDSIKVPDQVDWRKVSGRVSEVKDQGQCGSCWAFATTGVLEGQMAVRNLSSPMIKSGLVELSEQNLVDCSIENLGCSGGLMVTALKFVSDEGGIDDEKSYSYEGIDGDCRFNKSKVAFTDHDGALLPTGNEQKLKQMVAKFGPVAVAIDASGNGFQSYHSGVYYNKYCNNKEEGLNHGVLVVGYGTDAKFGDYWIVKNSWGKAWGDKGYIKMSRNRKNHCGIATDATIPTF